MKNVYFLFRRTLGFAGHRARTYTGTTVGELSRQYQTQSSRRISAGRHVRLLVRVPHGCAKGYTRFLGKLSELTDMGVEVHFFTGNHVILVRRLRWYRECGVVTTANPSPRKSTEKSFTLPTATDWATRTKN